MTFMFKRTMMPLIRLFYAFDRGETVVEFLAKEPTVKKNK